MEDFYNAGGLRALLTTIRDLLDLNCRTVSGRTLGEDLAGAEVIDSQVILPRESPLRRPAARSCCAAILHRTVA